MQKSNHKTTQASCNVLFVYGSLRRASNNPMHTQYLYDAKFISPAKIRGQLFRVSDYPGLALGSATDWVVGEIYLLPRQQQLLDIDAYEGCAQDSPQPHEYQRLICDLLLPSDTVMQAWVYVYKQSVQHFTRIESGDFLQVSGSVTSHN